MPVFPQLERLAWFHQQVKDDRYPNAARLSAHFEISIKTAQRDICFLRDRFDAPLEYEPARRGYYYTSQLYEMPCLPASQEEVLCLLLARRLLETVASGFISRELSRLEERIFSSTKVPGFCAERVETAFSSAWSGFSPAQEEIFRQTAWALLNHRTIRFTYHSPQTDAITQRTVEPHHLQHHNASWVLVAWCRMRQDWRNFLLARMRGLTLTDESFDPRPASAWRFMLHNAYGLFRGAAVRPVTLRFSPFRARWVREQHWHPDQKMTELPDGGLELTLPVADFREIKMTLLQFGADCEVVAPRALREQTAREIENMARLYRKKAAHEPEK